MQSDPIAGRFHFSQSHPGRATGLPCNPPEDTWRPPGYTHVDLSPQRDQPRLRAKETLCYYVCQFSCAPFSCICRDMAPTRHCQTLPNMPTIGYRSLTATGKPPCRSSPNEPLMPRPLRGQGVRASCGIRRSKALGCGSRGEVAKATSSSIVTRSGEAAA